MTHAEYRLSLPPRSTTDHDPAVASLLTTAEAGIGMIPNMYAHMANSPALLETYLSGYSAFRSESGLSAAEQEAVFLAISERNECDYCMAAHSAVADMAKVPTEITDAIRSGQPISDERIAALVAFTRVMLATSGHPTVSDVESFLAAGYSEVNVLHIVLAIAVKTLSNFSNHLFHTPVDSVFASRTWER